MSEKHWTFPKVPRVIHAGRRRPDSRPLRQAFARRDPDMFRLYWGIGTVSGSSTVNCVPIRNSLWTEILP